MKTGGIVLIVVAVAIAAAVVGAYAGISANTNNTDTTHDITYILDGGTNSPLNPDEYTEGKKVVLSSPSRSGYVFDGWYTDSEFTDKITSISADCKEDIKLYTKWHVAETYTITYVLNGGTNSQANPSTYTEGTTVALSTPTYEGYIFLGWYTDKDLSNDIAVIGNSTSGNITVYAGWEKSQIGLVLNYDFYGEIIQNYWFFNYKTVIEGDKTYSYLYYTPEKGYLMSYSENYTKKINNGSPESFSESDIYWTNESSDDYTWAQNGTETINTFEGMVECEIWVGSTSSSSETQYIGIESGYPYKIIYKSGSSTIVTYTLKSTDTVVPADEYEVKAYCDAGISVSGAGINEAYTEITLTASAESGSTFKGWYNQYGNLLSTSKTYTIDALVENVSIYALNDNDADLEFDSTTVSIQPAKPLTNVTWTVNDTEIVSGTLNYTFTGAGYNSVTYSGRDSSNNMYYGYYDIFMDGLITKNYTWKYKNTQYSTSLQIQYSDFLEYRENDVYRGDAGATANLKFVTYTDPYIVSLASNLMGTANDAGWSELEAANFILAFTQYIEYKYDEDSMGEDEYWKFPLETLFDQNGDCEDTSILFCAIAKAAGFDCCMLLFYGHMAAGVAAEGATGSGFPYGTVTYYYCETTSAGYSVGDSPGSAYTYKGSYYRSTTPII